MREIKFRVWDKCNERMVEPRNILKICMSRLNQEPYLIVYLKKYMNANREIKESDKSYTNEFELMQSIGLKDKKGVEIYEGDICKVTGEEWYCNSYFNIDEPWSMNMKVINEEYAFAFQDLQDKHKEIFLYETNYNDFEIEVIGNICENKELLEVEKSSEKTSVTFKKGNITFNQTGNNNTIIGSVDTLIL